eukprot:TRINITY_DN27703_c0_g1_i1.p2 TRINITY_DN27703_c0_g1~~TRINITY_DN27703_c0_g1_i1.p2  ORF type:complete len:134 (+),score=18.51 TRINITY_DN27703_c0_g1_i1:386-787(+)
MCLLSTFQQVFLVVPSLPPRCHSTRIPGAGFTAGLVYGLGGTAGVSWKAALLTGVGGRLLVARGAVGGLGAFGSPAAVVSLQEYIDDEAESNVVIRTVRPGYCMPHILGESEERCVWSSDVFSTARYRAIAAR